MVQEKIRPYLPNPQECAILIVLLIQAKERDSEKETTRFRVSELTLKRLWGRNRLPDDNFLREVSEWLFRAGWALFHGGATFALVKTSALEGWTRLSSKRLTDERELVAKGEFDFSEHYELLLQGDNDGDED